MNNFGFYVFCVTILPVIIESSLSNEYSTCRKINGYGICKDESVLVNVWIDIQILIHGKRLPNNLTLEDEQIQTISPNAFNGLTITSLYLEFTKGILNITRESFSGLLYLEELRISSIIILHDGLFGSIKSLRKLWITINGSKQTFNEGLPELILLERLTISNTKFNKLGSVYFRNFFPRISSLYLTNNTIESIEKNAFCDIQSLKQIKFENNGLQTIQVGGFNEMTNLQEISIHDENYTSIKKGVFHELEKLRFLDFLNSSVNHIDVDAFNGLHLESLKIENNNLSLLKPGIFNGLNNLTKLSLAFNNISFVPNNVFNKLPKLVILTLAGNRITKFEPGAFTGPRFMILDLHKNNLSSIKFGYFENLTTSYLNLEENKNLIYENNSFKNTSIQFICIDSFIDYVKNGLAWGISHFTKVECSGSRDVNISHGLDSKK